MIVTAKLWEVIIQKLMHFEINEDIREGDYRIQVCTKKRVGHVNNCLRLKSTSKVGEAIEEMGEDQ